MTPKLKGWKDRKIEWQNTPEGKRFKELAGTELFETKEMDDICDRYRRGYYRDEDFLAIIKSEIKQLELLSSAPPIYNNKLIDHDYDPRN